MTIEIVEPRTTALLQRWMESGDFDREEDAIGQALASAPLPLPATQPASGRTGADLLTAMQACPYPDFDFESETLYSPVRDVEF